MEKLEKREVGFCIVIESGNNVKNDRYKLALNSVFRQEYSNYKVVFIDDASTEMMNLKVESYVGEKRFDLEKVKILRNDKQKGQLENRFMAAKSYCG